jgi:cell division protein FtsW (lipid II flippase)
MDPTAPVATSPLLALFAFLGVIVLLLFLIAKWRWHVFLALLIPLLLFGLIPGVQTNNFWAQSLPKRCAIRARFRQLRGRWSTQSARHGCHSH